MGQVDQPSSSTFNGLSLRGSLSGFYLTPPPDDWPAAAISEFNYASSFPDEQMYSEQSSPAILNLFL